MTRAEAIRQMDDVQIMDWLCEIHKECKTCPFFRNLRCEVAERVEEEVEE